MPSPLLLDSGIFPGSAHTRSAAWAGAASSVTNPVASNTFSAGRTRIQLVIVCLQLLAPCGAVLLAVLFASEEDAPGTVPGASSWRLSHQVLAEEHPLILMRRYTASPPWGSCWGSPLWSWPWRGWPQTYLSGPPPP